MFLTRQFGALSNAKMTYFWRILAGVRPCLHMPSRAPGGIFGKRGRFGNRRNFRNSRKNHYGIFGNFQSGFLTTPPPIGMSIFPTSHFVALSNGKGYIFLAKHAAYTSASVLFVAGSRVGFSAKAEIADSAGICAIFRQIVRALRNFLV